MKHLIVIRSTWKPLRSCAFWAGLPVVVTCGALAAAAWFLSQVGR